MSSRLVKRLRALKERLLDPPKPVRTHVRNVTSVGDIIVSHGSVSSQGGVVVVNGVRVTPNETVEGSGARSSERRVLSPFYRVRNSIMGDVIIMVDPLVRHESPQPERKSFGYREPAPDGDLAPGFWAQVEGDENLLHMIHTEVDKECLNISMKSGSYSSRLPLVVRVTTTELSGVDHRGHGTLEAHNVTGESLEVRHSGMGDLIIHGSATETHAVLSGHGDVVIGPFQDAEAIDLAHTGMGDVTLTGTVFGLHARLTGHGDVHCEGLSAQAVNADVSGMGDASFTAKRVLGHHSGHGDVLIRGARKALSGFSSSGMGDVRYV